MGPTAAILVPTALTDDQIRASIEGAFRVVLVPDPTGKQCLASMDIWIEDRPIGIGHGEPYKGAWIALHRAGFADRAGWSVQDEIALTAMCNDDVDHVLLGRLCLLLAERFQGMIDLCGCPPARFPIPAPGVHWSKIQLPSIAEQEARSRAMVAGLPGRLIELPRHNGDKVAEAHDYICDAEFMRAWLAHEHFCMVK